MDRELGSVGSGHHDHREQVAGAVRPHDQPSVEILAGVFNRECMVGGVDDVPVVDAVLARRAVDFRKLSVIRNTRPSNRVSGLASPGSRFATWPRKCGERDDCPADLRAPDCSPSVHRRANPDLACAQKLEVLIE
ncbi:MAG TPA: hypothetical protein VHZ96_19555 [Frankiaceae bacterium]|nr:hypothetical protein [Frankiaceae bacterium]